MSSMLDADDQPDAAAHHRDLAAAREEVEDDQADGGEGLNAAKLAAKRAAFDRHYRDAYRSARAYALVLTRDQAEAEELMQAAAFKAWRFYDRYVGGCFPAWFTVIMRRIFFDMRRNGRMHRDWDREYARSVGTEAKQSADGAALWSQLVREFRVLPSRQREIAWRAMVEQHEYHEIADDLGIPIGTVMSNLFRARRTLMKKLVQKGIAA